MVYSQAYLDLKLGLLLASIYTIDFLCLVGQGVNILNNNLMLPHRM